MYVFGMEERLSEAEEAGRWVGAVSFTTGH